MSLRLPGPAVSSQLWEVSLEKGRCTGAGREADIRTRGSFLPLSQVPTGLLPASLSLGGGVGCPLLTQGPLLWSGSRLGCSSCPDGGRRPRLSSGCPNLVPPGVSPSSWPSQSDPGLSSREVTSGGCPHLPKCQPLSSAHQGLAEATVYQLLVAPQGSWTLEGGDLSPGPQHTACRKCSG